MNNKQYNYAGLVFEDIIPLKKLKRDVADAKAKAKEVAITGFNPFKELYERHEKGRNAALKAVRNEFSSKDDAKDPSKLSMSVNYIRDKQFVMPSDGIFYIGINLYMPNKKGFLGRLFSGSMGNWFSDVGVVALRTYVSIFIGKDFAKQISSKTVFNAIANENDTGKVSYYVALKFGMAK
jgi:hypothetical protein